MKEYFKRLKEHPGVGYASAFTVMGFLAGAQNKSAVHWYVGGMYGALAMGIVVWSMVLISNRK